MKRTVRENRLFCFLNYIPPLVRAVEFLLTITHNGRISCASGVGMPYGFKSRLPTNAVQPGSLIEVVVAAISLTVALDVGSIPAAIT